MKYQIIYADPPWDYDDKGCNGAAEKHYRTMTLQDICSLPVEQISDENSILFLWVTGPFMFDAKKVIRAWGFKYKTVGFVWVKRCLKNLLKWFFGTGHYTRGNAEFVLIAVRGRIKRVNASVMQVVETPILKPHSRKPDEVRERIEILMGDLPRIELFARQQYKGWKCLGWEIDHKDIRDAMSELVERPNGRFNLI